MIDFIFKVLIQIHEIYEIEETLLRGFTKIKDVTGVTEVAASL